MLSLSSNPGRPPDPPKLGGTGGAGTVPSLGYGVIKEPPHFDWTILQAESIIHQQYHIHIVRIRCGSNIAAENDESLEVTCALSQSVDVKQTAGTDIPSSPSSTKSLHYLIQGSLIYTRR